MHELAVAVLQVENTRDQILAAVRGLREQFGAVGAFALAEADLASGYDQLLSGIETVRVHAALDHFDEEV